VALSWFPNINWYNQPFNAIAQLTDPYLNLFRSLIPPLGGMDLSPMLALIALQVGGQILVNALSLMLNGLRPFA
jgi:YggT family protein